MGYACPVCAVPQRDGEHLAHHLAFTAMIHGDDHETWLDEHVPDWDGMSPAELAERTVPHVDSAAYDEVFEDTADRNTDAERGRPDVDLDAHDGHGQHDRGNHGPIDTSDLETADPETRAAVREARERTRKMRADEADDSRDGGSEDAGDGSESAGDGSDGTDT